MAKLSNTEIRKLDDAARAGWLYYVAGKTQDEIAKKLNTSRQSAQRMVALSVSQGLIKVRLDHPIAKCMDLAEQIKTRFGLLSCDVVPSDPSEPSSTLGLAQAGAAEIERHLKSPQPKVIANAKYYPMPLPVLPRTIEEKLQLHSQQNVASNLKLATNADVTFVGVGNLGLNSPLHKDGFVSLDELQELQQQGAVGEMISWVFDKNGKLLDCNVNQRVASTPLKVNSDKQIFAIAAGEEKVLAILGALRSKMISGLITNEYTAERLLSIE